MAVYTEFGGTRETEANTLKLIDDAKAQANKIAAPAQPVLQAVLVGGVTAGAVFGAMLLWNRLRKRV